MGKSNKKVQFKSAPTTTTETTTITKPDKPGKSIDPIKVSHSLFEVVVGSYERILYGLSLVPTIHHRPTTNDTKSIAKDLNYVLDQEFIFPAHIGGIKCLHVGESRYLASGSSDEIIKLYDMKTRKELGSLMEHKGSITSLEFQGKSHMVSSSEDGTLIIWRVKDWELLKTLSGHTGKVNSMSIHPSGKLAISVGSDRLMLAWNMMTGQKASSIRLNKPAELVKWSRDGSMYCVVYEDEVTIYKAAKPQPFWTKTSSKLRARFMSMDWVQYEDQHYIMLGCGDGSIHVYGPLDPTSTTEPSHLEILSHSNRIKSIQSINLENSPLKRHKDNIDTLKHTLFMVSVSSDGQILTWDLKEITELLTSDIDVIDLKQYTKSLHSKSQLESVDHKDLILASYHSNVRLTCLSTNMPYF